MNEYRTHSCGELRRRDIGARARLSGWVDAVRDHGGVVFLDLRDHYGVTQIVTDDGALFEGVGKEYVILVEGSVRERGEDTVNPKIETGEVEVVAKRVETLGPCLNRLPFEISESRQSREDLRLKFRFLDLRNPEVHKNILLRSEIVKTLRNGMESLGFVEINTPILTSSSPEGARDYLVPSRKHKGAFYALPQAPQQFKQLLMVSGFDRYFQIAPCFRDEDARADRSPGEFYQLDYEMAFATQEDVFAVAEKVLYETFAKFTDKKISAPPFRRIPYAECMLKYGSDKPDLRNPLSICDLTGFFSDVAFEPFKNGQVRGIAAAGAARMPKSFFEKMLEFATGEAGMKGLGYITFSQGEPNGGGFDKGLALKGPIVKFLSEAKQEELVSSLLLTDGDALFFISDAPKRVDKMAGMIRAELGRRLDLIKDDAFEFCFVTDFPMFERNEETGKIEFSHNPFSMPQGGLEALRSVPPLEINAYQYDLVCNGVELSSGAVRNCNPDAMAAAFSIAGYSRQEIESRFSAMYGAFHYGAPPHAGLAPGVDRIVMLLAGQDNIRETIAFPMNGMAQDLLMGAPGPVTETQLREAHIKTR